MRAHMIAGVGTFHFDWPADTARFRWATVAIVWFIVIVRVAVTRLAGSGCGRCRACWWFCVVRIWSLLLCGLLTYFGPTIFEPYLCGNVGGLVSLFIWRAFLRNSLQSFSFYSIIYEFLDFCWGEKKNNNFWRDLLGLLIQVAWFCMRPLRAWKYPDNVFYWTTLPKHPIDHVWMSCVHDVVFGCWHLHK